MLSTDESPPRGIEGAEITNVEVTKLEKRELVVEKKGLFPRARPPRIKPSVAPRDERHSEGGEKTSIGNRRARGKERCEKKGGKITHPLYGETLRT